MVYRHLHACEWSGAACSSPTQAMAEVCAAIASESACASASMPEPALYSDKMGTLAAVMLCAVSVLLGRRPSAPPRALPRRPLPAACQEVKGKIFVMAKKIPRP